MPARRCSLRSKTLTLPELGPYRQSLDRAVRRAAFEAEGLFDAHREEFDGIYSEMVENRNAQGRALGYQDYVPLSYLRMGRLGCGPGEVEASGGRWPRADPWRPGPWPTSLHGWALPTPSFTMERSALPTETPTR